MKSTEIKNQCLFLNLVYFYVNWVFLSLLIHKVLKTKFINGPNVHVCQPSNEILHT